LFEADLQTSAIPFNLAINRWHTAISQRCNGFRNYRQGMTVLPYFPRPGYPLP
jgi:hypothetical protein